MFGDDDTLLEEFVCAGRKPVAPTRPPRSYSPRYDRPRRPASVPGPRRRVKRTSP